MFSNGVKPDISFRPHTSDELVGTFETNSSKLKVHTETSDESSGGVHTLSAGSRQSACEECGCDSGLMRPSHTSPLFKKIDAPEQRLMNAL